MPRHSTYNAKKVGKYRSGLEHSVSCNLDELNCTYEYETINIKWEDCVHRSYTPDFILPNSIIIECKGFFGKEQRRRHLAIQKAYPHLDIRFVFTNSKSKIYKGSKTSYGGWCDEHGFKYADKTIPKTWIKEKRNDRTTKH